MGNELTCIPRDHQKFDFPLDEVGAIRSLLHEELRPSRFVTFKTQRRRYEGKYDQIFGMLQLAELDQSSLETIVASWAGLLRSFVCVRAECGWFFSTCTER